MPQVKATITVTTSEIKKLVTDHIEREYGIKASLVTLDVGTGREDWATITIQFDPVAKKLVEEPDTRFDH